ncbi:MAG: acyl-CoA dehydrogenase family protein [Microbacterium gubbeenense]|uniref:acyl-CoA dehydrogenase family protein n=1 Tax=Microbacterium gubbeenense TaxID=159896 RepID=UPI003F96E8EB
MSVQDDLRRFVAIAEEVGRSLAADVLERDRTGSDPLPQLDLLRESGLTTLLAPSEYGGQGATWSTAVRVIRALARTDASVAQVLAYHYVNESNAGFAATPEAGERWYRASAANRWIWGDSVNPTDPDLAFEPAPGGWTLRGTKRFSTGASAGDVILVSGTVRGGDDDGRGLTVVVERTRAGVAPLGDWDALGQRQSASGSVRFDDVAISESDVLAWAGDEPFGSLFTPAIQLSFGNLYLGIAEGALAQGIELVRQRRGSWFLSTAEKYRDDPFTQRIVGDLDARIAAAEALADRVGDDFDAVVARGSAVTSEDRGRIAIDIARLKIVTNETALDVANRVFEVTGSSSAKASTGLDLHWRNIRTHSLHDPVDFKRLEVGAYVLNGENQPISLYT